jgi:uncharacterized protein (TIGR02646 family)
MKIILKGDEPKSLFTYRQSNPKATWDQMKEDGLNNGRQAADDCRDQALADQEGLCAYCERKITKDRPNHCRVEHFHPKSDRSSTHNWDLDWNNMLACCDGGESEGSAESPLPDNLSCDAFKNHQINVRKKLPLQCDGLIINPLDIGYENLFDFDKGTGRLKANQTACDRITIPGNKLTNTFELVTKTIEHLNLNCERLARDRRTVVKDIDQKKLF